MSDMNFLKEVADHELSQSEKTQAGGRLTFPGSRTVGHYCTISWECQGFICGLFR